MPKQVKHIAVIRFSAMGDVAMTVPVLDCIARKYDVKLTMVSRPFLKPLFSSVPNLDFFPADFKNYYKGFFGLIRLYRDLKKRKVDAVADLHDVIRSKVIRTLFVLGGIPVASIDKGRTEKKALTRIENKEFRQLRHSVDRYADVFEKLGFPVNPSDYRATKLPLTENVLSVVGQKNQKWIGIAPFAQHEGKVYPEDLMRDVINRLADSGHKLFLFGGGDLEKRKLQLYAENHESVIVVAGALSFADELNLIANLDVMLSMDSANAHLAALYDVPVVTLWGATHPYAGFAPFNQNPEYMLTADRGKYPGLPTSVYGNKKIPGYQDAMRTIDPGDVVAKVLQAIG